MVARGASAIRLAVDVLVAARYCLVLIQSQEAILSSRLMRQGSKQLVYARDLLSKPHCLLGHARIDPGHCLQGHLSANDDAKFDQGLQ